MACNSHAKLKKHQVLVDGLKVLRVERKMDLNQLFDQIIDQKATIEVKKVKTDESVNLIVTDSADCVHMVSFNIITSEMNPLQAARCD